ncbi:iron complex outermembrane recepter protein [Duganella sp. CF402]|uniref:TonB-dependent siderophore receptor n=1 Tax=unclassified Duganella TaxID=2636909 RepID=UPI0008C3A093|nr:MULTISPECIES: TonB-dependent siderophore receptor [unclassified Duganella]RZT05720.1 iron complex outermembrane receptor protein [Duganella sp. BK701]SEM93696.1 iron complex outermembrane recepter protein [Duganella sp. CF402]
MFRPLPLCLALSAAFPAFAQDEQVLQAVKVTAARADGFAPKTVEAGSFRGADIMDVPSTVNVVTREVLELQAAGGLYDALRNTAGVTRQQNGGETWDQLVIRGIAVENRTNYRLNGSLPIMNFSQVPMEDKERVEVLKGATALYYGFTSPAGVVNFVTKRAGAKPVTTLGMTVDQNGSAVATADVARRFGEQQQVGVRVNAAGGTLGSYLDNVGNGNRKFASAALDWRVNARLLLKADLEYDQRRVTEQAGIALPTAVNGAITLPVAVDPKRLIGPDWAKFDATTQNLLLRADYALTDDWAVTVEGGHSETARDRALAIFRLTNAAALATGAGRITGNLQHSVVDSDMLRAELAGTVATGPVQHDLTFGATRTDKGQDPIYQANYTIAAQNLYNPVAITSYTVGAYPSAPTTAELSSRDSGVYAIDRLTFSPHWQAVAGVRSVQYRSDQGTNHYDVSKTTPMAALIYKLDQDMSFYASSSQGLEEGETAPTGSANVGVRMAPGVSRQKELGARWRVDGGTLVQAALFDISRPGYYTNSANVFTADGEQRYRGVELSAQGKLTRALSWQASAQWLDPEFRHINADYNGKLPENASRQTGSAFLSYELASGVSLNGGAYYTGRRPVNDLNQAFLGGVTLFSVGGRYAVNNMVWQLNVDNAADKRYWAGAGTRLASGAPRLIKLSVKVDL